MLWHAQAISDTHTLLTSAIVCWSLCLSGSTARYAWGRDYREDSSSRTRESVDKGHDNAWFYAQMYLCLCVCNVHVVDIMRASFAIYAVCESFFPIRCVMKYSSRLTDSYSGHKDCLSRQNPSKSNHRVDT